MATTGELYHFFHVASQRDSEAMKSDGRLPEYEGTAFCLPAAEVLLVAEVLRDTAVFLVPLALDNLRGVFGLAS